MGLCNFPLSPTIPSMEAVLSGNFLRRQIPAEQVDDILGILRTGDGNWSGGSLVAQCNVSLYPTLPSVQSMMATVLSGDFLRRPTTAEIADDIVGVLRPSEGNWTGPAASLCGLARRWWASTRAASASAATGQPWKPSPPLAADAVDRRSEQALHRPDHHPVRRQRLAANAADRRSEPTVHRPDH